MARHRLQNAGISQLSPNTVGGHLRANLPFVVFIMCECPDDHDWSADAQLKALGGELALLWASQAVSSQFELEKMYGASSDDS